MTANKGLLKPESGFFTLPNQVLFLGLSPYALAVFCCMAAQAEGFHPSEEFLARGTRQSRQRVRKSLQELVRASVIQRLNHCQRIRGRYEFNKLECWKYQTVRENWVVSTPKPGHSEVPDLGREVYYNKKKQEEEQDTRNRGPECLVEVWNQNCGSLPTCHVLSNKRRKLARVRLQEEDDLSYWAGITSYLASTPFFMGQNNSGWTANFDYLIQPDTHIKISERITLLQPMITTPPKSDDDLITEIELRRSEFFKKRSKE